MKILIASLVLISSAVAFANECDVVADLENANLITITNIDGDYKSIDFINLSKDKTKIEVLTGGHQDDAAGKAMMKGEYTLSERKIQNENYCVLKKKDDFLGVSYVALKRETQNKIRFYVGLSSTLKRLDAVVKEYNEMEMYFYLNI